MSTFIFLFLVNLFVSALLIYCTNVHRLIFTYLFPFIVTSYFLIFLKIIFIPRAIFTWGVGDILHIRLDAERVLGAGGFHLLIGVLRVVGTRRRSHELLRLFRPNVQGGGRRAVLTYTKNVRQNFGLFRSQRWRANKMPSRKGNVVVTG